MTGYQVYWSGGGGYDSGNMSARAEDRAVTITDRIPGLTYNITVVVLSDHLPSSVTAIVMVSKPRSVSCMYWSGGGEGADSDNMSAEAENRTVTITGPTPGITYNVALSDRLPSPTVGAVMVSLGEPHAGIVVSLCICSGYIAVEPL